MIDIYLITNLINNKQYVGKTQKGYQNRFKSHCNAFKNGVRTHIACAIHKYGAENFKIELLKQVEDDSWEYWENFYIKELHTHTSENGYNMSWGGDYNPMDDPEVRQRHWDKCHSPEFIEKQRKASTGKYHTEATKEKCRQSSLNNPKVYEASQKSNDLKKLRVGILENNLVVKEFSSLADACEFLGQPRAYAGTLKRYCDKYNKNGNRSKYMGYYWTILD